MKRFILIILTIVVCCSCSEESDNSQIENITDSSLIVGEWVATFPSLNTFTDIVLSENQRVEMTVVKDTVGKKCVLKEDVGFWANANNILSFTMHNNIISQHKIEDLDKDQIQLRNLSYNSLDTYHRVVETMEMIAGHEQPINYLREHGDFIITEITSGNTSVATVTSDGIVTAHQCGIAFVSLKSKDNIYYVKVNVKSRIETFSDETQIKYSELKEVLGDTLETVETENFKVYVYDKKDDYAIALALYDVDKKTDEIVSIRTYYNRTRGLESEWLYLESDWSYLKSYYYTIKSSVMENLFGKYKFRIDNSVMIRGYNDSNGLPLIQYYNYNYYVYK